MHVYILRRKNYFDCYNEINSLWLERRKKLILLWDETFNIAYLDFRKKLNEIREYNFSQTKFKKKIEFYSLDVLKIANSEGHFLYCTDDDDWYHDDIVDIIDSHKNRAFSSYRWAFAKLNFCDFKVLSSKDNWHPYFKYQTNNFVLSTPLTFKLENFNQLENGFINLNYKNSTKELFIDEIYSIYNHNLSSISLFDDSISYKKQLFDYFLQAKKEPNKNVIPVVFHKYIDRLLELYKKLYYR